MKSKIKILFVTLACALNFASADIMKFDDGQLLSSDQSQSGKPVRFNKQLNLKKLPLTVSADLSYEMLEAVKGSKFLSLGFTDGKTDLYASLNRVTRVDYITITLNDGHNDIAIPVEDTGINIKKPVGITDKLRFSVSITKVKPNNLVDLYISVQNLDKPQIVWGYEKTDVKLDNKFNDAIFAYVKQDSSQKVSNIKDLKLFSLEVSNKSATKGANIIPEGVDFSSFFLPIKPIKPLVSEGVWGGNIGPRDTSNGLESPKQIPEFCYWDGSIVKDDKGLYHMYASRWDQKFSHSVGWKTQSKGVHSVSKNLFGPYVDKGLVYPQWQDGKGHNVVGVRTFDGKYAVITSEITKGEIFIADNPDGPFELLGEIKVDTNGFSAGLKGYQGGKGNMSNVQIIQRPDGKYMLIGRSTAVMISEGTDIIGPYKIMSNRIYENMKYVPKRAMEDPTIWYSGGMYHMLVNHWVTDTTYHFSSIDGITDWKWRGIAFKKHNGQFRYPNGVVNDWRCVQRPTVYTQDNEIKAVNFSVINVGKGEDGPNDEDGSKVIIIPFDGKGFDKAMQNLVKKESK